MIILQYLVFLVLIKYQVSRPRCNIALYSLFPINLLVFSLFMVKFKVDLISMNFSSNEYSILVYSKKENIFFNEKFRNSFKYFQFDLNSNR